MGRVAGAGLDLSSDVRSTASMNSYDTHVLCLRIDKFDAIKHIKIMARQRCVGANGNCTG
jgi:hypothetical protein